MKRVDVLVVGAGPAGATAALNLARMRSVMLIDLHAAPRSRIGESLPPAARRLFNDMGLWERFLDEKHTPCYANRAVWGTTEAYVTDFLRDPDGHGWHLDRVRFESWLRRIAVERGAELLAPARLRSADRNRDDWQVLLDTADGALEITARFLIDAGGRAAPLSCLLGARLRAEDRLVCSYLYGKDTTPEQAAGFTYVEAAEDGWWYTAPTPGARRVLAFHTDSDLPAARLNADPKMLLNSASRHKELSAIVATTGFLPAGDFGFTAAHSSVLEPLAGLGWCSAGDAAMSFDPLSSQGLLNALFTGLAAAETVDRTLDSEDAVPECCETLRSIYEAYRNHLAYWYGAERRWSQSPFWERRLPGVMR